MFNSFMSNLDNRSSYFNPSNFTFPRLNDLPDTKAKDYRKSHAIANISIEEKDHGSLVGKGIKLVIEECYGDESEIIIYWVNNHSVLGYGKTLPEAISELGDAFLVIYESYVFEIDDELTLDAKELKNQLLATFKKSGI